MFTLVSSSAGQSDWTSSFDMIVNAPELYSDSFIISDVAGNNNSIIDPGEEINVIVNVENIGHANSPIAFAHLTCDNVDVVIENDFINVGQIAAQNNTNAVFEISADASIPIGTSITFELSLVSGSYNYSTSFSKSIGIIVEDFESGDFSALPWEFAGSLDWTISVGAYEGTYCAKSGSIDNNSTTNMVLEIDVLSDGEISFYRTVSSEANYDYLRFYIDGNQLDQWSGDEGWEEETYAISAGTHTVEWRYYKDTAVTGGTDCARIDNITFPPLEIVAPPIVNVNPTLVNKEIGLNQVSTEIVELSNIGGEILNYTISFSDAPEWLEADPISGSLNAGEMDEITLSFDSNGLETGQYSSSMVIENGVSGQTVVPVILTVNPTGVNENLPAKTELTGNYPNPFNPITNIQFSLKDESQVSLMIYNVRGQKVKTLVQDEMQAGYHSVIWNGTDEVGKSVSSGVYFSKFDSDDNNNSGRYTSVKKVILLK
jgi:hypothetical protein